MKLCPFGVIQKRLSILFFVSDPIPAIELGGENFTAHSITELQDGDCTGINLLSPMDRQDSTGLVSLTIDGMTPEEAVNRLWQEHRIVCRQVSFPPGLRISLHFFNTEEEVEQVVEALKGLV